MYAHTDTYSGLKALGKASLQTSVCMFIAQNPFLLPSILPSFSSVLYTHTHIRT